MTYQEKKEARIDRYRERAQRARVKGKDLQNTADKMASVIPFGQPILVGHHSEKSDRNYRKRIWNKMDKATEAQSKAEHYEKRAEAAETPELSRGICSQSSFEANTGGHNMKLLCIFLILSTWIMAWLMVGMHNACQDRIDAANEELNEYRANWKLVDLRAMNFHGVLWAYYDTGSREVCFINEKGVPCKLFRRR